MAGGQWKAAQLGPGAGPVLVFAACVTSAHTHILKERRGLVTPTCAWLCGSCAWAPRAFGCLHEHEAALGLDGGAWACLHHQAPLPKPQRDRANLSTRALVKRRPDAWIKPRSPAACRSRCAKSIIVSEKYCRPSL